MSGGQDERHIVCNFLVATKTARKGTLAWVEQFPGDGESVCISFRSRGGRWIKKWERIYRLTNFRWKTIPPEHPRYYGLSVLSSAGEHFSEEYLERLKLCADAERLRRGEVQQ